MKEVPKRQTTIKELQASESLESKGAPYETFEEFCISQSHMRGSYLCHTFEFSFWTELFKNPNTFAQNIAQVTVQYFPCNSLQFLVLFIYLFIYFLFVCLHFIVLFCYLNTLSSIRAIKKIFTQVVIVLALFS